MSALSKLLFGDVRWVSVLAVIGTAVVVVRLSRQVVLGWLLLALPVTLLVIEQAWADTLMLPFLALAVAAFRDRRWGRAGLLIGMAVTMKQFAAGVVLFAAIAAWREDGWRAARQLVLWALAVVALVAGPWVLWDAPALYESTVGNFLRFEPRLGALSWFAQRLRTADQPLPSVLVSSVAVASFAAAVFAIVRRGSGSAWIAATAFFFLAVFLVSKQAFGNYYMFVGVLVIFAMARGLSRDL